MTSLAEILILRGAVPIEALDRMTGDPARDEQWINELIDNEQVSPGQVAQARAVFAKLPFIELLEYPVDINAVALVPAAMCRRHEVLPVYMLGDQLTLAMVDPNNVFALDDVRATTGMRISVVVAETHRPGRRHRPLSPRRRRDVEPDAGLRRGDRLRRHRPRAVRRSRRIPRTTRPSCASSTC